MARLEYAGSEEGTATREAIGQRDASSIVTIVQEVLISEVIGAPRRLRSRGYRGARHEYIGARPTCHVCEIRSRSQDCGARRSVTVILGVVPSGATPSTTRPPRPFSIAAIVRGALRAIDLRDGVTCPVLEIEGVGVAPDERPAGGQDEHLAGAVRSRAVMPPGFCGPTRSS